MPIGMRAGALVVVLLAVVAAAIFGFTHRSRLEAGWRHRMMGQADVHIAIGKPFPALDFISPAGDRSRYVPAMGKVTVINVFATWCPPCRSESPAFARFSEEASMRGVEIMSIDRAESAPKIEAFRKTYGLTFPYLIDDGDTTKVVLGARAMPVTIVVDAKGIVRADVAGPLTLEGLNSLAARAAQPL